MRTCCARLRFAANACSPSTSIPEHALRTAHSSCSCSRCNLGLSEYHVKMYARGRISTKWLRHAWMGKPVARVDDGDHIVSSVPWENRHSLRLRAVGSVGSPLGAAGRETFTKQTLYCRSGCVICKIISDVDSQLKTFFFVTRFNFILFAIIKQIIRRSKHNGLHVCTLWISGKIQWKQNLNILRALRFGWLHIC